MMSPTDLFAFLGAPLVNHVWSWGATRPSDGVVFLRVWQDECRRVDGVNAVLVLNGRRDGKEFSQQGHNERTRHLDLIRAGARCYLVMCSAVDPTAKSRKISSINDRELFVGGRIISEGVDTWLELAGRVPVSTVRPVGS